MRNFVRIIAIALVIFIIVFFLMPQYVRTALIHTYPDIDDIGLFPYNSVEIGDPQPYDFTANYNTGKIDSLSRCMIEELDPVSFVVTKNGKLLYEEYWDNYTDSTNSNIFSASKSIISLLVGIAIDKGYITSVDDLASKYIPEWDKNYDPITIKDLLTMSSGLSWDESYSSLLSPTTKLYYGDELSNQVLSLEPVRKPGQFHYYSSATTAILGIILKNATGMTVSGFASKHLWQKIGAEHEAQWSLDHAGGIEKSYCCFYSNARDLARIGQLIINNGYWHGQKVISNNYLNMAFEPAEYLTDENDHKVDYYGYQWWLLRYKGYNIKYARGLYGQYIITIPDKNLVIVRLGNEKDDVYVGEHPKDVFLYVDVALSLDEQTK